MIVAPFTRSAALRRLPGVRAMLLSMGLLFNGQGAALQAVQLPGIPRISDMEYLPPTPAQSPQAPAPSVLTAPRPEAPIESPPSPRRLPPVLSPAEPRPFTTTGFAAGFATSPSAANPASAESTPAESTPAESTPAESTPAESTPADLAPVGPAPSTGLIMPQHIETLPAPVRMPLPSPAAEPNQTPDAEGSGARAPGASGLNLPPEAELLPTPTPRPDAHRPRRLPPVDAPAAIAVPATPSSVDGLPAGPRSVLSHAQPPRGVAGASAMPEKLLPSVFDFAPTPLPEGSRLFDPVAEQWVYDQKSEVPTQRPWIEWGRPFYGAGIAAPGGLLFGETNLTQPALYVYGDYRAGIASGRNAAGRIDNLANRLNLDIDWQWTATERMHAFIGPLNRAANFTQVRYADGSFEFDRFVNLNPVTAFFEGDAGAILGGMNGTPSPFEFPFTVGLVPLLYQNGIWMEDAVTGAAIALPARHSAALDWSNFDATAFAIVDQLNSPAFGADPHAAQAVGTAWFIEAYGGYIETGWAYLHDREDLGRSYHNITASFTRRYWDRISNSVRVIVNTGQELPERNRTADGALLLFESSLVTATPLTLVPYLNLFAGWDRPQSIARAAVSGGILRNVGINFDTDGLNGYPTLDASGNDTFGGAVGVDLLGKDLDRQLVLELAYLSPHGKDVNRIAPGDQTAAGVRYQFPVSHRTLIRMDAMYGWRDELRDIYGTRIEYRWKF